MTFQRIHCLPPGGATCIMVLGKIRLKWVNSHGKYRTPGMCYNSSQIIGFCNHLSYFYALHTFRVNK